MTQSLQLRTATETRTRRRLATGAYVVALIAWSAIIGIPNDPIVNIRCVTAYDAPAVKPVLGLFKRAKRLKVKVFFITARPEVIRAGTLQNLRAAGYTGKYELILQPADYMTDSKIPYKSGARKQIEKRGFHIVANVGDQQSDLKGGHAERTFKLPNPIYLTS